MIQMEGTSVCDVVLRSPSLALRLSHACRAAKSWSGLSSLEVEHYIDPTDCIRKAFKGGIASLGKVDWLIGGGVINLRYESILGYHVSHIWVNVCADFLSIVSADLSFVSCATLAPDGVVIGESSVGCPFA